MQSGSLFLNLSCTIVEFIAGGILDPALSLRIRSMTWGMRSLLGSPPFGNILTVKKTATIPWATKRFNLLGAMVTAVILMTGSVLVIFRKYNENISPQPVNDEGILWPGIMAVSINV